jgi:transcriptional regulator with XRE-family HTH domain
MQPLTHTQLLKALQLILEEKGITQTELAKASGFTQGNISRMFNARYAPQLDHFLDLVNAAGVTLAEIELKAVTLPPVTNPAP